MAALNFTDEEFAHISRVAPPRVASVSANDASFTNIPKSTLPDGATRFYLQIQPVAVSYELRFDAADSAGLIVPANVFYACPWPVGASAVPAIKLSSGSATVRALLASPEK